MSDHRFTDETATIAALNVLVNDMRHALGRIIDAYTLAACVAFLSALLHAVDREWFSMSLALGAGSGIAVAAIQTRRRRRKYHPATRRPKDANDGDLV